MTLTTLPLANNSLKRQLVRHFIEEALYDPSQGYFSRNANIFRLPQPIQFRQLADMEAYQSLLFQEYKRQSTGNAFYQLWHTPSELFKPHYAEAIANYISQSSDKHESIIIYEVGPGNGTLCQGLLESLSSMGKQCEYNLIEISSHLHAGQKERLKHFKNVRFINQSFFDIDQVESRPCYVVAMEVWDNLAQDLIMYDRQGQLLQGMVEENPAARYYDVPGRFRIVFEPTKDTLLLRTMAVFDAFNFKSHSLRWHPNELLGFVGVPMYHRWQYIPTGVFRFLEAFRKCFPRGRLIVSDFDELPGQTPGHGAPVVQTRFRNSTVACSTILLKKGLFDIFFPIDFGLISRLLHGQGVIMKHRDFLNRYCPDTRATTTKSGYNPMLEEFENVSFFLT